MFTTVNLYTPEGGFVTAVTMPDYEVTPQVIVLGARTFVFVDSFLDLSDNEGTPPEMAKDVDEGCYVEAFTYHVPHIPAEHPSWAGRHNPLPHKTPEKMDTREMVKTVYSKDSLKDRVYIDPDAARQFSSAIYCGCNIGDGYHFNECRYVAEAQARGIELRPVYEVSKPEPFGGYDASLPKDREPLHPDMFGGSDY